MQLPASNLKEIFAALQHLDVVPGGVGNVPVQLMSGTLSSAMRGRSAPMSPISGSDRPTLASLRRLERENAVLVNHAEIMARAVGACSNCWGTIEDCEECGGAGHPGAFPPDRIFFDLFVLPVIARVMSPADAAEDTEFRTGDDQCRDRPPN
jgi:hypothetical protein